MTSVPPTDEPLRHRKTEVRVWARRRRAKQPDKDAVSERIVARAQSLPQYRQARCVLYYVHVRDEVRTTVRLSQALEYGQQVAVPWCDGRNLTLFRLLSMDELTPGRYNILEPQSALREDPSRRIDPADVDLALAPGVAFDLACRRVGHGAGYYDRLLVQMRPDATLVGLAFDCQIIDQAPAAPHDIPMDYVATQSTIYSRPDAPSQSSS